MVDGTGFFWLCAWESWQDEAKDRRLLFTPPWLAFCRRFLRLFRRYSSCNGSDGPLSLSLCGQSSQMLNALCIGMSIGGIEDPERAELA